MDCDHMNSEQTDIIRSAGALFEELECHDCGEVFWVGINE